MKGRSSISVSRDRFIPGLVLGLAGLAVGCGAVAGSKSPAVETETSLVPLAIAPAALAEADAGVPYCLALSASGGAGPYSWDLAKGNLPPGLELAASSGVISGISNAAGSYSFTAQVSDSSGQAATADFTLTVANVLAIVESSIPAADAEMAYSASLSAAGGIPPYQWSIASGTLPAGVQLESSSGIIDGQTAVSGSYPLTVRVIDSGGQSATKPFILGVAARLAVVNAALPPGEAGVAYAATLDATGGTAPYGWSLGGGGLPSGLQLEASSGAIDGMSATAGSFAFTAQVTDSYGQSAVLAFTLTIAAPWSGPIVLNGQSGNVIQGLHISSDAGDCVQLIGSSNITSPIRRSDPAPETG